MKKMITFFICLYAVQAKDNTELIIERQVVMAEAVSLSYPEISLQERYLRPSPKRFSYVHPVHLMKYLSSKDRAWYLDRDNKACVNLYRMLITLLEQKNFSEAEAVRLKIIRNKEVPFDIHVFTDSAVSHYLLEGSKPQLAISNAQTAIKQYQLKKRLPFKYYELIYLQTFAHLAEKNTNEAAKNAKILYGVYDNLESDKPTSQDPRFFYVSAQFAIGSHAFIVQDYDYAIKCFEEVADNKELFLSPMLDDINYWLARTYEIKGDSRKARELYQRILGEFPTSDFRDVILYTMARYTFQDGRYQDAWNSFQVLDNAFTFSKMSLKNLFQIDIESDEKVSGGMKYLNMLLYTAARQRIDNTIDHFMNQTNDIKPGKNAEFFVDTYVSENTELLDLYLDSLNMDLNPDTYEVLEFDYLSEPNQIKLFRDLDAANKAWEDSWASAQTAAATAQTAEDAEDPEMVSAGIAIPAPPPPVIVPPPRPMRPETLKRIEFFIDNLSATIRLHPFRAYKAMLYQNIGNYIVLKNQIDYILLLSAKSAQYLNLPMKARADYRRIIKEYPQSRLISHAYFGIGSTYYFDKEYEKARKEWVKSFNSTKETLVKTEIRYWVGLSWYYQGEYDKAIDAFAAVEKTSTDKALLAQCRYFTGWSLFKQGKFGSAREAFQLIMDFPPSPKDALEAGILVGDCLYNDGEHEKALTYYKNAISSDSADIEIRYISFEKAASCYLLLDKIKEGITEYLTFLSSYGGEKELAFIISKKLAEFYEAIGDFNNQIKINNQITGLMSFRERRNNQIVFQNAEAYAKIGNYKKAIALYNDVAQASKGQIMEIEAYYNAALLSHEQRDYAESYKAFQKVIAITNGNERIPHALFYAGDALEKVGRPKDAEKIYARLLTEYPLSESTSLLRFRRGDDLFNAGKIDEAVQVFTEITNSVTGETGAKVFYKLGLCYMQKNDYPQAIIVFSQTEEKFGEYLNITAAALLEKGDALMKLNKKQEASALYKKLLKEFAAEKEILRTVEMRLKEMEQENTNVVPVPAEGSNEIKQTE